MCWTNNKLSFLEIRDLMLILVIKKLLRSQDVCDFLKSMDVRLL